MRARNGSNLNYCHLYKYEYGYGQLKTDNIMRKPAHSSIEICSMCRTYETAIGQPLCLDSASSEKWMYTGGSFYIRTANSVNSLTVQS